MANVFYLLEQQLTQRRKFEYITWLDNSLDYTLAFNRFGQRNDPESAAKLRQVEENVRLANARVRDVSKRIEDFITGSQALASDMKAQDAFIHKVTNAAFLNNSGDPDFDASARTFVDRFFSGVGLFPPPPKADTLNVAQNYVAGAQRMLVTMLDACFTSHRLEIIPHVVAGGTVETQPFDAVLLRAVRVVAEAPDLNISTAERRRIIYSPDRQIFNLGVADTRLYLDRIEKGENCAPLLSPILGSYRQRPLLEEKNI